MTVQIYTNMLYNKDIYLFISTELGTVQFVYIFVCIFVFLSVCLSLHIYGFCLYLNGMVIGVRVFIRESLHRNKSFSCPSTSLRPTLRALFTPFFTRDGEREVLNPICTKWGAGMIENFFRQLWPENPWYFPTFSCVYPCSWNFWMNFTGISCVKFYTAI